MLWITDRAALCGYKSGVLDTLKRLASAAKLYTAIGYKPIEQYVHNPMDDALFFGIDLTTVKPLADKEV